MKPLRESSTDVTGGFCCSLGGAAIIFVSFLEHVTTVLHLISRPGLKTIASFVSNCWSSDSPGLLIATDTYDLDKHQKVFVSKMGGGYEKYFSQTCHNSGTRKSGAAEWNRGLWGLVDMGSNGIRLSITDQAHPQPAFYPLSTLLQQISLYEAQYGRRRKQFLSLLYG